MLTSEELQKKISEQQTFKKAIRNHICPFCGGKITILPNPYGDGFVDGVCCGKTFYINEGIIAND